MTYNLTNSSVLLVVMIIVMPTKKFEEFSSQQHIHLHNTPKGAIIHNPTIFISSYHATFSLLNSL